MSFASFQHPASSWSRLIRPVAIGCALAVAASAAGCSSSSSGSADSAPSLQSRADLGCGGVSGPLDGLESTLTNTLTAGLGYQPVLQATTVELTSLVSDVLDLVDATAQGAGSLLTLNTNQDPKTLAPLLNQALCVTAAVGDVLTSVGSSTSSSGDDAAAMNSQLAAVSGLQARLQSALDQLAATGAVPSVAGLLQDVTDGLSDVLSKTVAKLPVDGALAGILGPVAELLVGVGDSLATLQSGDTRGFAADLVNAVEALISALVSKLGPLGVVLTPVVNTLNSALDLVSDLLGRVLGLLL